MHLSDTCINLIYLLIYLIQWTDRYGLIYVHASLYNEYLLDWTLHNFNKPAENPAFTPQLLQSH